MGRIRTLEVKEVKLLRKESGLRAIKKGRIVCLKCDKKFISKDIIAIRICDKCKRKNSSEGIAEHHLHPPRILYD
tara:strand:- start:748 stop:972 length:225 start_codon:yes stop_codon:yes gene_type:complete